MFNQASGRPSSNHGLFHKYGIEAVTLKGIRGSRGGSVGFYKLGRYKRNTEMEWNEKGIKGIDFVMFNK